MGNYRSKAPFYSLSEEKVALNPDFPIHLISFSDPQDPIISLHSHDVLELGVCLRGNGIFIIGSGIHSYEEGDMIAIGPGVYHRAKSGLGMKDFWHFFYFNPGDWRAREQSMGIQKLIKQSDDPHLNRLMLIVTDEIRGRENACRESIEGLLKSICVRLNRLEESEHGENSSQPRPSMPRMDERITRAIDLLISSKDRYRGIRELAEACNLSESHFRHVFKKLVGMSPKQFQTKLKINTAMNRLKSEKTRVLDISLECGFESLSSFNRQFKNETGLSPLQWRTRETR